MPATVDVDTAAFHCSLIYKNGPQAAFGPWVVVCNPYLNSQKSVSMSSLIVGQTIGRSSLGKCSMFPWELLSGCSYHMASVGFQCVAWLCVMELLGSGTS